MKQTTLKELGWDHIDFVFDVKYVAGDYVDGINIAWHAYQRKPGFWEGEWEEPSFEGLIYPLCTEPHPMAQFPEHTLIEIVEG